MSKYGTLRDWDKTLPDGLGLEKHINNVRDFLRDIVPTPDDLGLIYLMSTPAEFQLQYGHAPNIPVAPGPFQGTVLDQRNQQVALDIVKEHKAAIIYALSEVYRVWPQDIRRIREDHNDSLSHCNLATHYAALRLALGGMTEAGILRLKEAVRKPYHRESNIDVFVKDQLINLQRLTDNGHALNDTLAVSLMKEAYMTTERDRLDFKTGIDKFMLDFPLAHQRTPAEFARQITSYVKNLLPHFSAINPLALAKAATEEPPPTHPLSGADQQELLALRAEKAAIKLKQAGQQKTKPAVVQTPVAPRAPRTLAPGAPAFYCWSHGTDFTGTYPHYSHENCKAKRPGHQRAASLANQMGGKPA